jgi:hypothetical protein
LPFGGSLGRFLWAACSFLLLLEPALAGTAVIPTTTFSAETGKNTSAADSFGGSPNGNIAAGANVSKVATPTLLYPGATTRIYAHFMPWFGWSNHYDVGYHSNDPAQINAQVTDMLSRGITGMIIDWYGEGSNSDLTTLQIKPEAESRNGQFEFAIMEDKGSVNLKSCSDTASCTSAVIADLTYAYNTYENSAAYMRWNGRPVVFFFGVEALPVDWASVRAQVPGNPILVFENSSGFTRTFSDGGFAWVMPSDVTSSDLIGMAYLNDFYSSALSHADHVLFATGYKGFDDTIADWSLDRHMQQRCGQTWLESMAAIGKYYNTNRQLPAFQVVTWNDYEEGTEIESGIDNCLTVNASVNGDVVSWSSTGNENTLDHYTVFISADGQNLMSLGDYATSTHAINLSEFGFNAGTYKVYVKAVGKPSIVNHMSADVSYTASGAPPAGVTDFALSAPAARATVSKGNTANYSLSLIAAAASSGNTVVFSCSGLPEGAACTFNPISAVLGSAPVPVSVSISTRDGIHASNHFRSPFVYAMTLPVFGTVAMGLLGSCSRRCKLFLALLAGLSVLLMAGCGGAMSSSNNQADTHPTTSGASGATPSGSYTITIAATAGDVQRSTGVSLTVQ